LQGILLCLLLEIGWGGGKDLFALECTVASFICKMQMQELPGLTANKDKVICFCSFAWYAVWCVFVMYFSIHHHSIPVLGMATY
jgi:hypothetical protein